MLYIRNSTDIYMRYDIYTMDKINLKSMVTMIAYKLTSLPWLYLK